MENKKYNILVNFEGNDSITSDPITIVKGDYNSVDFEFQFNKSYNLALFFLIKPNGKEYVTAISGNTLTINDTDIFDAIGKYQFGVSIYDENSKLTIASKGKINVVDGLSIDSEKIESDSNYQVLDGLIKRVESLLPAYNENALSKINEFNNNAKNKTEEYNEKVNELLSNTRFGSPLIATSIDEMTDTTRIYVNTVDGNWYYYNGTNWLSGGVFQSVIIGDNSIDENMLEKKLMNNFNNALVISDFDSFPCRKGTKGNLTSNDCYTIFVPIKFPKGTIVSINPLITNSVFVVCEYGLDIPDINDAFYNVVRDSGYITEKTDVTTTTNTYLLISLGINNATLTESHLSELFKCIKIRVPLENYTNDLIRDFKINNINETLLLDNYLTKRGSMYGTNPTLYATKIVDNLIPKGSVVSIDNIRGYQWGIIESKNLIPNESNVYTDTYWNTTTQYIVQNDCYLAISIKNEVEDTELSDEEANELFSKIKIKPLNEGVLKELEINNLQSQTKTISTGDMKDLFNFELGNITIWDTGWTYGDSTTRVRTPEGYSVPLKEGDVIGLTDYSNARYYLGGLLADGTYVYHGWLTSDMRIRKSGDYVVLICNLTDTELSSHEDLSKLFHVARPNSIDTISKNINALSMRGIADYDILERFDCSCFNGTGYFTYSKLARTMRKPLFSHKSIKIYVEEGYQICYQLWDSNGDVQPNLISASGWKSNYIIIPKGYWFVLSFKEVNDSDVSTLELSNYLTFVELNSENENAKLLTNGELEVTYDISTDPISYSVKIIANDVVYYGNDFMYTKAQTVTCQTNDYWLKLCHNRVTNTFALYSYNTQHDVNRESIVAMIEKNSYVAVGYYNARVRYDTKLAPIIVGKTGNNFVTIDSINKIISFPDDTIILLNSGYNGSNSYAILNNTKANNVCDFSNINSTAIKIYYDTKNDSLFATSYSLNHNDFVYFDKTRYILLAFIRVPNKQVSISCPYVFDDLLFGIDINKYIKTTPVYFDPNITVKSVNHRGFNKVAPENTLSAYKLSKENGFDIVECDVSFTSDGVAVLLHDASIDRTSNGTGNIADLTFEEARQYDYGSWKSSDYAGEVIPTFEEFIALCRNLSLHPYIELKGEATEEQIRNLVDITKKYGMLYKCSWISFSYGSLLHVKNYNDSLRLGFVVGYIDDNMINTALTLKTDCNEVFMDCNYSTVTNENVIQCMNNDLPLEVWTINGEDLITSLNPYVSGVTSDNLIASDVLYDANK